MAILQTKQKEELTTSLGLWLGYEGEHVTSEDSITGLTDILEKRVEKLASGKNNGKTPTSLPEGATDLIRDYSVCMGYEEGNFPIDTATEGLRQVLDNKEYDLPL